MSSVAFTEANAIAWAQALGAHALAGFLGLLVLLLLGAAVLAWSLRRFARGRRRPGNRPLARLGLSLALAFVLIVGAGFGFASIAGEIGAGASLARVDQAFSDAVRASTPQAALLVFGWVTHLGDPLSLVVLCVALALALFVRGERLLAVASVAAIAGNAVLNPALKRVFERVRPLHENGLPLADSFSFPSGHSSGSLVAYGMLAYVLLRTVPRGWHLPAVLFAAAAAFSVGCSRIFLQMHFATDVLAGFASGTAWLASCIVSVELARRGQRRDAVGVLASKEQP